MNITLWGTQLAQTTVVSFKAKVLHHINYAPYGNWRVNGAFQGHRSEGLTGFTFGSGYRLLATDIGRFCQFDESSPFSLGGLNGYAFVMADPVNNMDPSGRFLQKILKFFRPTLSPHTSSRLQRMTPVRRSIINRSTDRQPMMPVGGSIINRSGDIDIQQNLKIEALAKRVAFLEYEVQCSAKAYNDLIKLSIQMDKSIELMGQKINLIHMHQSNLQSRFNKLKIEFEFVRTFT